jgi:carbon monoxide dehydrogenase subunit G
MDMTGEYRIAAARQKVWEALNDAEILKAAIPGCEELVKKSDTELEAKVTAKVGPVKAKFGGAVTLADLNPPESYTISGQGSGGAAGFAKGGASVYLTEDGDGTLLRYEAKAEVGGKLAQIGSRLIQGTAKKMADDFFGNFSRIVAERAAPQPAPAAPAEAPAAKPATEKPAAAKPAPAAVPRPTPPPPAPSRPAQAAAGRGGLAQSPWVWLAAIVVVLLLVALIFG